MSTRSQSVQPLNPDSEAGRAAASSITEALAEVMGSILTRERPTRRRQSRTDEQAA